MARRPAALKRPDWQVWVRPPMHLKLLPETCRVAPSIAFGGTLAHTLKVVWFSRETGLGRGDS